MECRFIHVSKIYDKFQQPVITPTSTYAHILRSISLRLFDARNCIFVLGKTAVKQLNNYRVRCTNCVVKTITGLFKTMIETPKQCYCHQYSHRIMCLFTKGPSYNFVCQY
jgi:hypothetical protein